MNVILVRALSLLMAVLSGVIIGLASAVALAQSEPVRVGIYQNPPKLFLDETNQPAGFFPDLLNHIAAQENWTLEYVPCVWNDCLTAIENGTLDLMMDVAYSDARAKRFDFNREVVLSNWSVLYVRKANGIHSILDTDQKLIAVVKGSIQHQTFKDRAGAFGVTPQFVETQNFEQVFELIDQGKADAGLVNRLYGAQFERDYDIERSNVLVKPSLLHFIVPRHANSHLVEALDEHLMRLKGENGSAYYQAIDRWLSPLEQRGVPNWLSTIAGILVLVLIAVLFFTLVLRRQVSRKTAALQRSLLALKESEKLLSETQKLAHAGSGEVDLESGVMKWSDEIYTILALPRDTIPSADAILNRVHSDDRERVTRIMDQFMTVSGDYGFEHRIVRPDGTVRNVEAFLQSKDGGGPPSLIRWMMQDITERKQAEEALQKAKAEAEAANLVKSEFLASMSHELRTPLNAVLGFAQMLQFDPQAPLSPTQNEHVESILTGGEHLLELVNEVLDLAKIEANKLDLSLEEISANDVVEECVALTINLGEPRDITIIDHFSGGSLSLLRSDRLRFKQSLINLLSNAVKYNQDGGTVTVDGRETEDGFLRISVKDTGVGIAEEHQSNIFHMFHRLDGDPMIAREGTGIGLTVTKLLVEQMAGRIGFESEEGVGSTFWIKLPLASNEDVLIWTNTMRVGVDAIDKDHQVIISLVNRITHRAIDDVDVDAVIKELIDYTHYHFRREEAIMEVCGDPDLEKHRDYHQSLDARLNELANNWHKDRDPVYLHRLREFLRDWLFKHVIPDDTGISQYARGKEQDIREALERLE